MYCWLGLIAAEKTNVDKSVAFRVKSIALQRMDTCYQLLVFDDS